MNTTHIYTLSHPETGVIRYVGKANQLGPRYALHLRKDEATAKSCWIQSLKKKGLTPKMEVLDIVPSEEWQFWEVYWIAQLKAWGCTLYNGDNGGLGSDRLPDAVKNRIADTLRGRSLPKMWVIYHQYDLQGHLLASFPSSAAAAAAVSGSHSNLARSARTGRQAYGFVWRTGEPSRVIQTAFDASGKIPLSDEFRKLLSERQRGKKMPPVTIETRAKMRAARLGVAPANKGVPQTAEQRERSRQICPTKKTVLQLEMNGTLIKQWPSIKEAALATGATRVGITKTSQGKNKHSAGFKWQILTITNPS